MSTDPQPNPQEESERLRSGDQRVLRRHACNDPRVDLGERISGGGAKGEHFEGL